VANPLIFVDRTCSRSNNSIGSSPPQTQRNDQALLFNYVGDKIQLFRPSGIRGSVEFATVGESLASSDVTSKERASTLVDRLAAQSGIDCASIENAIQTTTRDLQGSPRERAVGNRVRGVARRRGAIRCTSGRVPRVILRRS
jgi:hypothetical protein